MIDKILLQHEWFKHDRFGLQLSVGTLPHDKVMKAIELFGTVVKPAIDKALPAIAGEALRAHKLALNAAEHGDQAVDSCCS